MSTSRARWCCAALIFDVLDGRIARWRQKASTLGQELDSLSDVISFGVAPAMIAYGVGMQGFYDRIILVYFIACGVSRLARYNVTAEELSEGSGKVKYFEGTPIPTSILLVAVMAVAAWFGAIRDESVVRRTQADGLHAASARAAVRAVGLADDQPDSDSEAVANTWKRPRTGYQHLSFDATPVTDCSMKSSTTVSV